MMASREPTPASGLRANLVTDFAELERIAAEWDLLWESDPRSTVFGKFAWARATWRAYGAGLRLCTPVVRSGERLVGVFPLARNGGGLRFLSDGRADYNDILCAPGTGDEVVPAALEALARTAGAWTGCVLRNVSQDSNLLAHLPAAAAAAGLLAASVPDAPCPYIDLGAEDGRHLASLIEKKSLRIYERNLGRIGPLRFRHLVDRDEARAHLEGLFRQHIARWTMTGGVSLFQDPAARSLYRSLLEDLDPARELRFSVMEVGGKPAAYHFGFQAKGVFILYKITFNVDFWDQSPGQVQIKKLLEYARDERLRRFDFTAGDESYKFRFANGVAMNHTVRLFPPGPGGRGRLAAFRMREGLKRTAPAGPVWRRARRWTGRARTVGEALRRLGPARFGARLARRGWHLVFSNDMVVVFSRSRAVPGDRRPLPRSGEVRPVFGTGSLGDLAALAEEHREFRDVARLARARDRLRRGDTLHLAWLEGRLAHVAWSAVRSEVTGTYEVGPKCRIPLEEEGVVIYDCWTPPAMRGRGMYPRVLREIAGEGGPPGRLFWIYCRRSNAASMRGILKAGFEPRYRMHRVRILRWSAFNSVKEIRSGR